MFAGLASILEYTKIYLLFKKLLGFVGNRIKNRAGHFHHGTAPALLRLGSQSVSL